MATPDFAICKNIERELKALIMPAENQQSSAPGSIRNLHAGSSQERPNYENDFPVLGSESQRSIGLHAHQRKNQNYPDDNRSKRRDDKKGRQRGNRSERGNAAPRSQQYPVNGVVSPFTSLNSVQSLLADKVIVDLSQNPVAPPKKVEYIDKIQQPFPTKNDLPLEASPIESRENRQFFDVNFVDRNSFSKDGLKSQDKNQRKKGRSNYEEEDFRRANRQGQRQEAGGSRRSVLLGRPELFGRRNVDLQESYRNVAPYKLRDEGRNWDRKSDMQDPRKIEKIQRLKEEFVFPLKKPSQRYPGAQFFCHLCSYHCNFDNVDRHIAAKNHKSALEVRRTEMLLKNLPFPSPLQTEIVMQLLEETAAEVGLSEEDMKIRQSVIDRLNQLVSSHIPGCSLKLYGSSITGFGLKNSDVNIDILLPPDTTPPIVLKKLHQLFRQQDDLTDVRSEFDAKLPRIFFFDKETGLCCDVSWNNVQAYQTSKLLADYASLDARVKTLGKCFRYWAKMCKIDCQERGTLPAHLFGLLLVYFLQQHKPAVLPVLHELLPGNDAEKYLDPSEVDKKWKSYNEESVGELWIELLRFYSVGFRISEYVVCIRGRKPVLRGEKNWTGKVMAVEDPYCRKRNLTRSISSQIVYRYIQERFCMAYKYFGIPQTKTGPLFTQLPKAMLQADGKYRVGEVDRPPIREYEDDHKMDVEAEDGPEVETKPKDTNEVDCSDDDDDADDIIEESNSDQEQRKFPPLQNDSSSDLEGFEDNDPDLSMEEVLTRMPKMGLGSPRRKGNRTESESSGPPEVANARPHAKEEGGEDVEAARVAGLEFKKVMTSFEKEEVAYDFDMDIFTGGKLPPIFCSLCSKEGHLQQDCPDEILPELIPLPPMTAEFMAQLDEICEQITRENVPSAKEVEQRQQLLQKLEDIIKETYPDAKLDLYGSSCNGFGFTGSDLDICVTLTGNETSDGLDFVAMISTLATNFEKHKDFVGTLAITTAKVPIVKVTDRSTNIECDISFYNTLAQHNTRMLRMYSEIDRRAQVLGYTMKHFAKLCEIGDASRGSLSSYAFILMVLHYLQQRNPPVLPVLQELYDRSEKQPQVIVEGWNAWFYDDMDNLASVWPEMGKNKETVGELWLGLFRYYAEEFDRKNNVICVRQKDTLTCFEKMWNSKSFAIEDPFDLNHNLGSAVSCKMNTFIMKTLINGRRVFGIPVSPSEIRGRRSLKDHLFDPNKLKDGQPPNDRGCRRCGKIGHKIKDCPQNKLGKNRFAGKPKGKWPRSANGRMSVEEYLDEVRRPPLAAQSNGQDARDTPRERHEDRPPATANEALPIRRHETSNERTAPTSVRDTDKSRPSTKAETVAGEDPPNLAGSDEKAIVLPQSSVTNPGRPKSNKKKKPKKKNERKRKGPSSVDEHTEKFGPLIQAAQTERQGAGQTFQDHRVLERPPVSSTNRLEEDRFQRLPSETNQTADVLRSNIHGARQIPQDRYAHPDRRVEDRFARRTPQDFYADRDPAYRRSEDRFFPRQQMSSDHKSSFYDTTPYWMRNGSDCPRFNDQRSGRNRHAEGLMVNQRIGWDRVAEDPTATRMFDRERFGESATANQRFGRDSFSEGPCRSFDSRQTRPQQPLHGAANALQAHQGPDLRQRLQWEQQGIACRPPVPPAFTQNPRWQ